MQVDADRKPYHCYTVEARFPWKKEWGLWGKRIHLTRESLAQDMKASGALEWRVVEDQILTDEEAFEELVSRHDLTFEYSDDGRVWRRGRDEREHIIKFGRRLPEETALRIWNFHARKKMSEGYKEQFIWTEWPIYHPGIE